jgi:hypothetical protein
MTLHRNKETLNEGHAHAGAEDDSIRELKIPTYTLFNLVRYGVIPAPARDFSGHYLWSPEDQARARAAIEARAHRARLPKPATGGAG